MGLAFWTSLLALAAFAAVLFSAWKGKKENTELLLVLSGFLLLFFLFTAARTTVPGQAAGFEVFPVLGWLTFAVLHLKIVFLEKREPHVR